MGRASGGAATAGASDGDSCPGGVIFFGVLVAIVRCSVDELWVKLNQYECECETGLKIVHAEDRTGKRHLRLVCCFIVNILDI